ncbi:FAD/NAD(P)-binding protein [Nocardioidaceae bacterium]|nr:FAD/NAD(P)-binding protein [Nocardioidaceae bacterium]
MVLPPARPTPPPPLRVVVVGGGAAAVMAARAVLDRADAATPVAVTVVERHGPVGPGLPYRSEHPWHLLNNYAGRLSAVDGDPDHLVRWAARRGLGVTGTSFVPRALYGRYLRDLADTTPVPPGSLFARTVGEAVDLRRLRDSTRGGRRRRTHLVVVRTGGQRRELVADHVVLALGTPPPARLPHLERAVGGLPGARYVPDPWATDLTAAAASAREVLVIGSGLTMVDVVCALHHDRPDLRFTVCSRTGALPTAHTTATRRLDHVPAPGGERLDDVVAALTAQLAACRETGTPWRPVVDAVRARANSLWAGFTAAEQHRFVAEHARTWETLRHRMAPDSADLMRRLMRDRTVVLDHPDAVDPSAAGLVVNATGPRPVPTAGWNPLVDRLLETGTLRPHRLGLGVDVDVDGHPLDASGRAEIGLTVLGAGRRGAHEWEVTAVPDLRTQTTRLAHELLPSRRHPLAPASAG